MREAEFRALFYHLTAVAAVIGTPKGRVLAANAAACRLFGMSERELCALRHPAMEIRRGDGATVEVELDFRISLNEKGVERSVVLLYEGAGDVEVAIPLAYDLAGHLKLMQAELRVRRLESERVRSGFCDRRGVAAPYCETAGRHTRTSEMEIPSTLGRSDRSPGMSKRSCPIVVSGAERPTTSTHS